MHKSCSSSKNINWLGILISRLSNLIISKLMLPTWLKKQRTSNRWIKKGRKFMKRLRKCSSSITRRNTLSWFSLWLKLRNLLKSKRIQLQNFWRANANVQSKTPLPLCRSTWMKSWSLLSNWGSLIPKTSTPRSSCLVTSSRRFLLISSSPTTGTRSMIRWPARIKASSFL